ncbi:hypothetical protein WJX73_004148 [Symbiochloris irregularis]|uniref:Uncharacterized protein n=1 Tax=Symbiochloris irregularis TaxID=706552 RepID=A0AAW1PQE3_9CHLO
MAANPTNDYQLLIPEGGGGAQAEAAAVSAIYFFFALVAVIESFIYRTDGHLLELALFGAVRGVAFVFRALLEKRRTNSNYIIFAAIFNGGFFLIVSAGYFILASWARRINTSGRTFPWIQRSLKWRYQSMPRIANFASVAFAVCGIVSAIYNFDATSNELQYTHGTKLNKSYAVGFAGLTALLTLMTFIALITMTRIPVEDASKRQRVMQMLLLFIVAALLTVKSAWLVVGAWILRKAYRRRYFYPLSCLPEMVALAILLWPGFLSGLVGQSGDARATGSVRDAPDGAVATGGKKGGFMTRFRNRRANKKGKSTVGGDSQFPTTNNGQATTMGTPTRTPMTTAANTHPHNGVSPASTTDTAHDYHGDSSPDVQQV